MDKKDSYKDDERENERRSRHRPDKTLANWLAGFLICVGVIIRA